MGTHLSYPASAADSSRTTINRPPARVCFGVNSGPIPDGCPMTPSGGFRSFTGTSPDGEVAPKAAVRWGWPETRCSLANSFSRENLVPAPAHQVISVLPAKRSSGCKLQASRTNPWRYRNYTHRVFLWAKAGPPEICLESGDAPKSLSLIKARTNASGRRNHEMKTLSSRLSTFR
jgi:hypothetical protein